MTMKLEISEHVLRKLNEMAKQQDKTPEDVAIALLDQTLHISDDAEFLDITNRVVEKNAELYRRLA